MLSVRKADVLSSGLRLAKAAPQGLDDAGAPYELSVDLVSCCVHGNQQARIPRPRGHPPGAGMLLSLSRLKESVVWRCLRRVIRHGQGNEESNMSGIPSTRRGSGFRGGTSRSALFFLTRSYKRLNDDPGFPHGRADGDRTRIRNALSGARPGLTRNRESHPAVSLQFGVQPTGKSRRSPKPGLQSPREMTRCPLPDSYISGPARGATS